MQVEERILKSVSDVTGVPISEIKGKRTHYYVARARMMYYYLCAERGMQLEPIGKQVNRDVSSVSNGIYSFDRFLQVNGKYRMLTERVRGVMVGSNLIDDEKWMEHNEERFMYHRGVKYSILDVSSKYFGESYIFFEGDNILGSSDNINTAVSRIMLAINERKAEHKKHIKKKHKSKYHGVQTH